MAAAISLPWEREGSPPSGVVTTPPASRTRSIPGGVVPGLEPVLHKAVQAARGQVAQLQRGRADPADVVAAVIEQAHPPEGPVGQLPAAGVGARGAEALPQGGGGADMDGPARSRRRPAPCGQ